jgi:hypothetical protein
MTLIMSHFNPLRIQITYLSKRAATLICHVYTKWYIEAVQPKFCMNFSFTVVARTSQLSQLCVTEHNIHTFDIHGSVHLSMNQ